MENAKAFLWLSEGKSPREAMGFLDRPIEREHAIARAVFCPYPKPALSKPRNRRDLPPESNRERDAEVVTPHITSRLPSD
jgi:hypothetical protein